MSHLRLFVKFPSIIFISAEQKCCPQAVSA
jgi:hypothetical protein